jgi:hypothetical protein
MRVETVKSLEWSDVHWKPIEIDLSAYTGTVQLRFALQVDRFGADKGWVLDDVMVWSRAYTLFLPLVLKGD